MFFSQQISQKIWSFRPHNSTVVDDDDGALQKVLTYFIVTITVWPDLAKF